MDIVRMEEEREILLDWVARNKPRRRNRTLSVPGKNGFKSKLVTTFRCTCVIQNTILVRKPLKSVFFY